MKHETRKANGGRLAGAPLRIFRPAGCVLFLVLAAGSLPPLARAGADLADPDAAVQAGRDGLRSQPFTPWYDRDADGYRPLNVRAPRRSSNWQMPSLGLGEVFRFVLWLLIAAVAVAILLAFARQLRRATLRSVEDAEEDAPGGDPISRVDALPMAIEKPLDNLLDESRRRAAAGDLLGAVVYLFSHQLVEADRAGALRLRKGKTNRQYLRELRRNRPTQPELAALLESTTLLFERAFFGARAPTGAELDERMAGVPRFDALLAATHEEVA